MQNLDQLRILRHFVFCSEDIEDPNTNIALSQKPLACLGLEIDRCIKHSTGFVPSTSTRMTHLSGKR